MVSLVIFLTPLTFSRLHTIQSSLDFKFLSLKPFISCPTMETPPQFRLLNHFSSSIIESFLVLPLSTPVQFFFIFFLSTKVRLSPKVRRILPASSGRNSKLPVRETDFYFYPTLARIRPQILPVKNGP